jgi:hypothetical protein
MGRDLHNPQHYNGWWDFGEGRHPAFQCIFQLLYRFILDILQQCKINKNTEHPDSFHDNALLAKILADAYQKNICLPILLN